MKKYIISLCIVFAAAFCYTACNEEDFSKREFYEYFVYLLSKEDNNVYNVLHPFVNEGEETIGFFSIGVGGSRPNPDPFTVELEQNRDLFDRYNRYTYDVDSGRYAKLLSPRRYHIDRMMVDFPENNKNQYVKVRVHIDNHGLSPDSNYFIPISIKSVSGGYETNPDYADMLYRVVVKNYYAEQIEVTTYSDRGAKLQVLNPFIEDINQVVIVHDSLGQISETKVMRPLSKNSVRVMAGEEKEARLGTPTIDELIHGAMVLTMDNDYTEGETYRKEVVQNNQVYVIEGEYTAYKNVQISSYGTVQIEQIDDCDPVPVDLPKWNIYCEERANQVDDTVIKYFYLRYRYRTLVVDQIYTPWTYVQTRLRKQE